MKIVHICFQFSDGWTYQENLLTKYHKQLGHEVTVVTSNYSYNDNGELVINNKSDYLLDNGVKIIRLSYKKNKNIDSKFKDLDGLYFVLENEEPDVLFIHGFQWVYIKTIVKYLKKHKNVRTYVDNHVDFSNSATNFISKNLLHGIVWKHFGKMIAPFAEKFYGVLPARVDILHEFYKLPKEKTQLLVMGADDELVNKYSSKEVVESVRNEYNIEKDDFLLVFGGKIDLFKKQILLLMDAVNELQNDNLKLLVFGSVVPEMKDDIEKRCSKKVKYIGWKKPEESFPIFASANLVVFPGRHSVFWEQVAGQGIPMLVKHWDGTTHVDLGGNVKFLYIDSKEEIKEKILEIMEPNTYSEMKKIAVEKGMKEFSYLDIAKRSIEKE